MQLLPFVRVIHLLSVFECAIIVHSLHAKPSFKWWSQDKGKYEESQVLVPSFFSDSKLSCKGRLSDSCNETIKTTCCDVTQRWMGGEPIDRVSGGLHREVTLALWPVEWWPIHAENWCRIISDEENSRCNVSRDKQAWHFKKWKERVRGLACHQRQVWQQTCSHRERVSEDTPAKVCIEDELMVIQSGLARKKW